MQSVSSGAVYNAIGAIQSNLNNKANGNGGCYFIFLTPRQLNTNSAMIDKIGSFPVGSIVLFQVGWEEYTSFSFAGSGGYFIVTGGSNYAFGQFKQYVENKYTWGFKCTDNANNYSGIYQL